MADELAGTENGPDADVDAIKIHTESISSHSSRRKDPSNAYALVFRFGERFGFPAVMVFLLMGWIYLSDKVHRQERDAFVAAIKQNTAVLEKSSSEEQILLKSLDDRLRLHLEHEDVANGP